ncbi:MAG: translocation/assembly module TamB domain-containing protein [Snowella sp.]|nr:translocation/assembly module TamB domain-containing protein [Snowella sp.]
MLTNPKKSQQLPESNGVDPAIFPIINPRWRKNWILGISGLSLLMVGGGYFYGQHYAQTQIAPLVEQGLSDFINRPVKIGKIEHLSVYRIRFGTSSLEPTATDPSRVSLRSLDISFNPLQWLFSKKLNLSIAVVQPQIFLEQGYSGEWLRTPIDKIDPDYPLQIDRLKLEQASITLVTRNAQGQLKPAVPININQANLELPHHGQSLNFQLDGKLGNNDQLTLQGSHRFADQAWNLSVRGNNLSAIAVNHLIPLPVTLQQGNLDSNLAIQVRQSRLTNLQGTVNLQGVTANLSVLPKILTNVQGVLRFQGTQIGFDQIKANLGKIATQTQGIVDFQKNYDLNITTQPVAIADALQTFDVSQPKIALKGNLESTVQVKGDLNKPQITATLKNSGNQPIQLDKFNFKSLNTQIALKESNLIISQLNAIPIQGGQLQGQGVISGQTQPTGKIAFKNFRVNLQGSQLALNTLAPDYQPPIPIAPFSGQTTITGQIGKPETIHAIAALTIPVAGGNLSTQNLSYQNGKWQGDVEARSIQLAQLPISKADFLKQGYLNGKFNVQGEKRALDRLKISGLANIAIAQGTLQAKQVSLINNQWQASVVANNLSLRQVLPNLSLPNDGKLQGTATLSGNLQDPDQTLTASGQGKVKFAQGSLTAQRFQLQQGQWTGLLTAHNLPVTNLTRSLPTKLAGNLTGQIQLTGSAENTVNQLQGRGKITLSLPQGKIRATQVSFTPQQFQATLQPQSLQLKAFNPKLKGNLRGKVNLQGKFEQWKPQDLQAEGNINLSRGFPGVERPLNARFALQDNRLTLDKVTAPGLQASGSVLINESAFFAENKRINPIQTVDLNVAAQDFSLSQLAATQPFKIPYQGQVDFEGRIKGKLQNPEIQGDLALKKLKLDKIAFDPVLSGQIHKTATQGLNVNLAGKRETLRFALDAQSNPVSLMLKREAMQIKGVRDQSLFFVTAQQVPLDFLRDLTVLLPQSSQPLAFSEKISGDLSGNFTLNLADRSIIGTRVAIDQPRFGTLSSDRVTGNLDYSAGKLNVTNSQLMVKNNPYPFQVSVNLKGIKPKIQGEITVPASNIQTILETLQIFRLEDLQRGLHLPVYNTALDLYPKSPESPKPLAEVGLPKASLYNQLAYLSEINRRLQQQRQQQAEGSPLPELSSLQGTVAGKLTIQGEIGNNLETAFDFTGKDWQWADYKLDNLQLQGNWQNGTLTLNPLQLQTGNSLLVLKGMVGEQAQMGELSLTNIPLKSLATLINLPANLSLDGELNANISLAGNRANPQAQGSLSIENAVVNQASLQATEGKFAYQQGRFDFSVSSVLERKTEPLILAGSIPYVLPFATVQPESDRFNLSLKAKNEGLGLLALATKGEVNWLKGKGDIQLDVFGRIDPQTQVVRGLQVEGNATIQDATLAASVFPDSTLTQVNGKVHVDLNQLNIQALTGQLNGGNVAIAGSLPLLRPNPQTNPLTVTFEHSAFKLKDLYQGGIKGNVQITGSVMEPDIGGSLDLYKGEIQLGEALPKLENQGEAHQMAEFNDFKFNLGENIRVQRSPILDFLATGSLTLNGTLTQLRPEGSIALKGGQINLFASQLRLAGGDNVAQFSPHRGLDPYLNLRLVSAATETNRNSFNANPSSSEINEPFSANRESLQMIRIQALVQGYASQLSNSIQLTSTPRRSQRELIALLGGGFINTLGQEETTLGLVNLAGSAVLGGVQGQIGEALGLSRFRIFPTALTNDQDRTSANQLGVAAEAGVDLTHDLSVSIQKIINTERSPQWGLRYRVNENTVIRGSTNFSDDSRGVIEYEQRF